MRISQLAGSARVLLALGLCIVVATACGDDGESGGPQIEFFDGVVPSTVPDDFPLPDAAIPGAALVNSGVDPVFTEVTMRIPAPRESVFAYFQANLPLREYSLGSVNDHLGRLTIEFTKGDLSGTLDLQEEISIQVTTVVLKLNPPG